MKMLLVLTVILYGLSFDAPAQNTDKEGVTRACMNYIEGFYEGDQDKLRACLQPSLHKFGFWKDNDSGKYSEPLAMSYDEALNYAQNVKEKKEFPDPEAPKSVEVLDVKDYIAVAKVTAWWGEDYILLSKQSGKWMIEQVIWEGPYSAK